jgi:hypothetical protein
MTYIYIYVIRLLKVKMMIADTHIVTLTFRDLFIMITVSVCIRQLSVILCSQFLYRDSLYLITISGLSVSLNIFQARTFLLSLKMKML